MPFVMMGYRVPNYTSEDSYALDVLESILSHGKVPDSIKVSSTIRNFLSQSAPSMA